MLTRTDLRFNLDHYHPRVKEAVELTLTSADQARTAMDKLRDRQLRFRFLNRMDDPPTRVTGAEIPEDEIRLFGASVWPCLFVCAANFDPEQNLNTALLGHFSVAYSVAGLDQLLENLPAGSQTWVGMAGFGGRTSRSTLGPDVERGIMPALGRFGISYQVRDINSGMPEIFNPANGHIVSDIGGGVYTMNINRSHMRRTVWAVARRYIAAFSFVIESKKDDSNKSVQVIEASLITSDQGRIRVTY